MYCILTKNLSERIRTAREQLDSGGGGALSQGSGHDGNFSDSIIVGKFICCQSVSLEKSGKHGFLVKWTARFCTAIQRIRKSFRHALHLVTAHLHRQNQIAHALHTRDFRFEYTFRTARARVSRTCLYDTQNTCRKWFFVTACMG